MKKFFAIVAMAAVLLACGDKPDNGGNNGGNNHPVPDVECEIAIDGSFADWDAIDSKIQKATLPTEGTVTFSQLKTLKLYADEVFIYIFCEFDPTETLVMVPYFDTDSDGLTGNDSKWSGAGYEAKAEGDIWSWSTEIINDVEVCVEQLEPKAWAPSFYVYTDDGTECVYESGNGAVISSVPCATKDGLYAFEAAIVREFLYAYELGDTFTMGMYQYNKNWDCVGQLPCITDEEMSAGDLEYMLTVALP